MRRRLHLARAAGAALAALLAFEPVAAVFAAAESSSCCCHHRDDERCSCPTCAHRREVSSSSAPVLKSCATQSPIAAVASFEVFVPAIVRAPLPRARAVDARGSERTTTEAPPPDVPTPPPLA